MERPKGTGSSRDEGGSRKGISRGVGGMLDENASNKYSEGLSFEMELIGDLERQIGARTLFFLNKIKAKVNGNGELMRE